MILLLLIALASALGAGVPARVALGVGIDRIPRHTVSLDWAQGDDQAVSNNVYRAAAERGPFSKIYASSVAIISWTDPRPPEHETSYYAVTEVDAAGDESAYSNIAIADVP